MYFDPSYFREEVRYGFTIKPMMKKVWAAQLEVLQAVDAICKRHQIMYYAEWGTLLGAVRHQGFVPWDDDMDIGMLRKDFMRFKHYAAEELPGSFELLSTLNQNHDAYISRVINGRYINTHEDFLRQFHGSPYIVGLDIFITDNLPSSPEEAELQKNLFCLVHDMANVTQTLEKTFPKEETVIYPEQMLRSAGEVADFCKATLDMDQPLSPQFFQLAQQVSSMYWDEETGVVGMTPNCFFQPFRHLLKPEYFTSTIELPFEGIRVPVPVGYAQILSKRYGAGYLAPRRYAAHDYPFYASQREGLISAYEKRGIQPPDYLLEEPSTLS